MPDRRNTHLFALIQKRNAARRATALVAALCLVFVSCSPAGKSKGRASERVVDRLLEAADGLPRNTASVIALNTLCTLSRLADGEAEGRVETALASYISGQTAEVKSGLVRLGDALQGIDSATRSELLGAFASFDPGACDAAPDWDGIRSAVLFSHQQQPRLRTNSCSNNLVYADGTVADREITSGAQLHAIIPEPDGGPDTRLFTAGASPAIMGLEGEFVSARHPDLDATVTTPIGEGMTPFGVETGIPCSLSDDSACDPAQGLLCSTRVLGGFSGQCVAYPVVQKDQAVILRGYNFWDVLEARLMFDPVVAGSGIESTSIVDIVDANEPTDGAAACAIPSPGNATHNRAHFRVTANEGHFYRLRMFNHNGQYLTQQDALDHAPGRDIHVCYPPSIGPDDVPPGTLRDCDFPFETCAEDGATCAGTWNTPPRQLDECRHLPGEPLICGETPEWFENQPLTPRADDLAFTDDAIVFVEAEAPVYEFAATLRALECEEETGLDFLGSDEPMLIVAGFPDRIPPGEDAELAERIDDTLESFKGGDYDSGTRRIENHLLSRVDSIPADGQIFYVAMLMEDDGFLEGFLLGAALIVGTAVIVALTGGAAILTAVGGAAVATSIWAAVMGGHSEDDPLGTASFLATPIHFAERIGATHADDFLTTSPPLFGALPAIPDGPSEGEQEARLIHPFEDFSLAEEPLAAECNPGVCGSGETCLVNRCRPDGFTDPLAGVGFRERREFELNGGHYVVDLVWERRQGN